MPESRVKTNKRFEAGSPLAGQQEPRCAPWTAWARLLIHRYEPVKQPQNLLDMALVHPFTTIRLIQERWIVATRELKPQINLFLNPKVLRVSRWHLPDLVNRFGDVRNESYVRATSLTLAGASPRASDLPVDQAYAGEPDLTTKLSSSIAQHLNAAGFERDVRKLVTTGRRASDETSRIRTSQLLLENANALAQRLLTHTRRVEARIAGLAELTLRRISATLERQTASAKSPADEPQAPARMAAIENAAASMQDEFRGRGIDVDQLTDRVIRELDRRVVAVRERMGRM